MFYNIMPAARRSVASQHSRPARISWFCWCRRMRRVLAQRSTIQHRSRATFVRCWRI